MLHDRACPPVALAAALLLVASSFGRAGETPAPPGRGGLPEVSALPARPGLPDPLVLLDGTKVANRDEWIARGRPELKRLFQHTMYGAIPPRPARLELEVLAEHGDFLGGKATLKAVAIGFGSPKAPRIDLLLIVPNGRVRPAPAFLAMNFCGNHAVVSDPRVPLAHGWLYSSCKGCVDGRATEAARGGQAGDWPVEEIVSRGYALATFCSSDVDSDRADVSDGIYAWLAGGDPEKNAPHGRGSIAAWAWGYHRCMDYLATDPDVDATRVAAVGHSRNGKTTLLAAAFDERIALAIPHQAGCGGTAPSRGKVGESVRQINDRFPHWFCGEFKEFNDAPERLPFDQNALVALVAPRPVLFSNAVEDTWANPDGQFEVLRAADGVYLLLGVEGLAATERPEVGKLVKSRLGYWIRPGRHSMVPEDWKVFLEFADAWIGP